MKREGGVDATSATGVLTTRTTQERPLMTSNLSTGLLRSATMLAATVSMRSIPTNRMYGLTNISKGSGVLEDTVAIVIISATADAAPWPAIPDSTETR